MRDVTIYRHEDGHAAMIPWKDREQPTKEELHPTWAKLTVYTIMPHDWVYAMQNKTKDEVTSILSRYI